MDKNHILNEIRRTAEANGGVPLGVKRFQQVTGIAAADWRGKVWARWSDAIHEAGYTPNQLQAAYSDDIIIRHLVEFSREVGRFPVFSELRLKARRDANFPSHNVFSRLGSKQQLAQRVLEYCSTHVGCEDVAEMSRSLATQKSVLRQGTNTLEFLNPSDLRERYVYLAVLRIGRETRYKIGKAIMVERRRDQISIQLPEDLELIHTISTDDAYGIESYWHKRFTKKNIKGEWFMLSYDDVKAFRKRKFM